MKKVLTVQDLSCLGKCSLTVALPVLSAMGCSCSVLPTAVLSTHTAFPAPHVRSLTGDMVPICHHWKAIGAQFDAVSIGYLSDPEQAAAVEHLLDTFPATVVLDPVLGDHGKLYTGITQEHVQAMKRLCHRADVLLPNLTEACLLTDTPYEETPTGEFFQTLLQKMQAFGADTVILTGVSPQPGMTGYLGFHKTLGEFSRFVPRIPKSCHGTGDLFAAVLTGSLLSDMPADAAAEKAATFVETVLQSSEESPFGMSFEPHLGFLQNN